MARQYAYGRRTPAPRPPRAMQAALFMGAALDALGPAPAESPDYISAVAGRFGTYENNSLGDCVCVDTANGLILRTANASGTAIIPPLADVLRLYEVVGGWDPQDSDATDNGCDEQAMCNYIHQTGFMGHASAATGPVDQTNLDHLKWAQLLFGSCRLGWNLPGYAEDLFNQGKPWDVQTSGDQSTAGHDTALVDFRGGLLYVVSWYSFATAYDRNLVAVTPAFFQKYCEEAHGEVFPDWIRAQGTAPSGFNLADLVSKLGSVA